MATGKENQIIAGYEAHIGRITRSRAAAACASGGPHLLIPLVKPDQKQVSQSKSNVLVSNENAKRGKLKRPALVDCTNKYKNLGGPNKKRMVLRDVTNVTNVCCDDVIKLSVPAPKAQIRVLSRGKFNACKTKQGEKMETKANPTAITTQASSSLVRETECKIGEQEQMEIALDPIKSVSLVKFKENLSLQDNELERDRESNCGAHFFSDCSSLGGQPVVTLSDSKEEDMVKMGIVDIDFDKGNTQLCTNYAPDLYANLRARELLRRPSSDFMETLQRDINPSMRGILIDWLVEVCDEYRLVPDTLYLTVYLIDRFLSLAHIERQRLQLLGITCLLIASKYEEICAPRVEEFCFITDNTYTKNEVLKMEHQVLSRLGFHISVPTIKSFLRRFLRAAQASRKASPTLMHLTNYLAELTLIEYSFLNFLPSEIAASAVFLARFTLDQSDKPWNETLEHYTGYKPSELKSTVLALQGLQLKAIQDKNDTQKNSLKAIREKYGLRKYESVATLTSEEIQQTQFW